MESDPGNGKIDKPHVVVRVLAGDSDDARAPVGQCVAGRGYAASSLHLRVRDITAVGFVNPWWPFVNRVVLDHDPPERALVGSERDGIGNRCDDDVASVECLDLPVAVMDGVDARGREFREAVSGRDREGRQAGSE
jgi:hypothetical protein